MRTILLKQSPTQEVLNWNVAGTMVQAESSKSKLKKQCKP